MEKLHLLLILHMFTIIKAYLSNGKSNSLIHLIIGYLIRDLEGTGESFNLEAST